MHPRPRRDARLEEERDRAERVKQDTPILVILGNPPYNGFAGMAVDEERTLTDAYGRSRTGDDLRGRQARLPTWIAFQAGSREFGLVRMADIT